MKHDFEDDDDCYEYINQELLPKIYDRNVCGANFLDFWDTPRDDLGGKSPGDLLWELEEYNRIVAYVEGLIAEEQEWE